MLKAILFRVAAVLIGLGIFVLALEVYLRIAHPEGISVLIPDQLVGQRYRTSFSQERSIAESGERVVLRFHSDGFRGPERDRRKPAGVRRVVIHGDSEIAAIAVREENTLCARLEDLLNAGQAGWEVMNFGVSGYSTGQSLLAWRHFSRLYEPDIVVLNFFVTNDVTDNSRETSSRRRPYFYLSETGDLLLDQPSWFANASSRWLTKNLRFYTFQKGLMYGARHGARQRVGKINKGLNSLNRDAGAPIERAWVLTGAIIERFREEVEAAGSRFVLMIDPSPGQYDDDVWQAMLDILPEEERSSFDRDLAQETLRELLAGADIETLDLLPEFRRVRPEGPLSFGPTHWNVAGNDVAARALHRQLTLTPAAGTE